MVKDIFLLDMCDLLLCKSWTVSRMSFLFIKYIWDVIFTVHTQKKSNNFFTRVGDAATIFEIMYYFK